ncbi:MAG: acyl-CoA dehydrogenase family protein [Alphaproteobacteria bacterium]|jgi:alkylation response protein AidB-like acyl-CoA dehydrogenase
MEHFQEAEHVTMLRDTMRRFVEKDMPRELAQKWDRENEYPREIFEQLSALGVNALTVPEEYGGAGRDITATMVVIEELARRSMAVAVPFIMCACYGAMNIEEVGSDEQKAELLPKLAEGKLLFAYGISEPDVGADVASVRTTAVRKGNGATVTINGSKRFCSGANIADYIYTVVKSDPEAGRYKNLSIVMIPPDAPGVTIELQNSMGMKGASTCDVTFEDVEIPAENIVGGEAGWNDGWSRIVGPGLDVEKIEVAALALGNAAAAVDDAWEYAQERKQFGKPVSAYQSVRHMLVDAKTKLHACRLMTYHAAWLLDEKKPASVETSMAKLYVSDTAKDIVLSCQQVMGAYGYIKEFDMERYVREALLMPIIGGSSAIQKNNIANRLRLARE